MCGAHMCACVLCVCMSVYACVFVCASVYVCGGVFSAGGGHNLLSLGDMICKVVMCRFY